MFRMNLVLHLVVHLANPWNYYIYPDGWVCTKRSLVVFIVTWNPFMPINHFLKFYQIWIVYVWSNSFCHYTMHDRGQINILATTMQTAKPTNFQLCSSLFSPYSKKVNIYQTPLLIFSYQKWTKWQQDLNPQPLSS